MISYTFLIYAPLLGMLLAAAVSDVRQRRIPNWLSLMVVVSGLLRPCVPGDSSTFSHAALGMGVGFAVAFILFALRGLGGGDVKLLAGIGAWLGGYGVLVVLFISLLLGMVLAIVEGIRRRRLMDLLGNTLLLTGEALHRKRLNVEDTTMVAERFKSVGKPLPFAVPMLAATALALLILPSL